MSHNNLWGLGHQASFKGYFGSSQGIGLGYLVPWVGDGQKIGLLLGGTWRQSSVCGVWLPPKRKADHI